MKQSEKEWKDKLTPEQYRVMRQKGTEAPFSGKYVHEKGKGMYTCAACGNELFSSDTKFDSQTGWPSFHALASEGNVKLETDLSLGMNPHTTTSFGVGVKRTEVSCAKCGAHLGHVFDDGPEPSGKRYCINSVCLDLKKEGKS